MILIHDTHDTHPIFPLIPPSLLPLSIPLSLQSYPSTLSPSIPLIPSFIVAATSIRSFASLVKPSLPSDMSVAQPVAMGPPGRVPRMLGEPKRPVIGWKWY